MLQRWEVEGPLRTLHPMRQHARRMRRTRSRARYAARVTVAVLLGAGLLAAHAAVRMASRMPTAATEQDSTWGDDHVGSYHVPASPPLFPTSKRHGLHSRLGRRHRATALARD